MTNHPHPQTSAFSNERIRETLRRFEPDASSTTAPVIQKALFLARHLQQRAAELLSPQERRQQAELDRMIQNPHDKATLVQLTDQAFRTHVPQRAVDQVVAILDAQGIPRFFSPFDRTLLKGFQSFGSYLPGVAVPLIKEKMRQETANVILPADDDMLARHLEERRREGVRMNVNYLGEALLGEEEAQRRLNLYLQALQMPETECISVKISTIYSQISPLAREHSIADLCDRMELLYRAAAKGTFTRGDGTVMPKFVYMDMEEYRDMSVTAEVFMRTLSRKGLEHVTAGMALQAYVPDSYAVLRRLIEWASQRVSSGGAPVMVRVVKGANMEMERVEASLEGWPQAPFKQKIDTDANFKRMIHLGMADDHLEAVRLGVASHNLFDVAYAIVLAEEKNALDKVQFEMLEGMANHQRRAVFELTRNMLLYAPACKKEEFIHAIGYLVRRLDENTGPDNFLHYTYRLTPDSDDWRRLEDGFLRSFDRIARLSDEPRRTQDRNREPARPTMPEVPRPISITFHEVLDAFPHEPHTDFALPHNSRWAAAILEAWRDKCDSAQSTPESKGRVAGSDRSEGVPLPACPAVLQGARVDKPTVALAQTPIVIAGDVLTENRPVSIRHDPSRPNWVVARSVQATPEDIDCAVACAAADEDGWRSMSYAARGELLRRAAHELRKARAALIGAALAEGGKTIGESDPEVSEAVDFVEFYNLTAQCYANLPGVKARGVGVVAVIPPWNFPIAIPTGGVAAALAAGNTVILKPAPQTVLVGYLLCECFWRAGVSKKTLQFAPCPNEVAQKLATHDDVDAVIFTGGTETAYRLLRAKPTLNLFAETGGKNAIIVTGLADRDQAIKNVIHSAFGHGGQKCSAASLLLLEEEVFNDPQFKSALCDAIESLYVGSAWDLKTQIGPLIRPPNEKLQRGLKELEPGESWALMPKPREGNPNLYSPGVKWNVQPGSATHTTEFFGPVLGVMKFRRLDEAIAYVNGTGYGLTSGLESLDLREQQHWLEGVRAGNLYLNRGVTGAIVLRQPFGGMGKSNYGPGIKAGGPNYVAQFMQFVESDGTLAAKAEPEASAPAGAEKLSLPELEHLRHNLIANYAPKDEAERQQIPRLIGALASYNKAASEEFSRDHDHARLIGQDNFRRYLPLRETRIRIHPEDSFFEVLARVAAAKAAGCRITVSLPVGGERHDVDWLDDQTHGWGGAIEFLEESDEALAEVIRRQQTDRVRYAARERVPSLVREAAIECGFYLADWPVRQTGRLELLGYVREQSISINYHRYGNLGDRAQEPRQEPA